MTETRKLAAILAADVAGYSRLTGADEEGTLKRLRELRRELIDPTVATNRGRIVKTTGDGILIEFASVVDAVRCAVDVQRGMKIRNADFMPEKRIEFRVGINLGDVMVEADGDLMGDGVNIAARLEGIAEPGGICISEDAYHHVRDKVTEEFIDLGTKELKNIARPVRVYSLQVGMPAQAKPAAQATPPAPPPKKLSMLVPLVAALVVVIIVIAGGAWYFLGGQKTAQVQIAAVPAEPAKPAAPEPPKLAAPRLSIVVLPFVNASGDPAQDYLADVLTDELTTDLALIHGSFVIARNTAFTYKGKPVDTKAIGKDLGVRYMLEGSVQPTGNQVRVNAQLIDTVTGAHLWADRFDTARAGLLQMQDEIVTHLARALEVELTNAEAARLKRVPATNPDAEDLALRCQAIVRNGGLISKETDAGYLLCEEALAADPDNVRALAWLSWKFWVPVILGLSANPGADLKRADELASHALLIDSNYASAHAVKAWVLLGQRHFEDAIVEGERALVSDPISLEAWAALAEARVLTGQWEKAIEIDDKLIRVSPNDKFSAPIFFYKGCAYFGLKQDEQAIEWLRRSVAADPGGHTPTFYLAAALALSGHDAEAHEALERYLAIPGTRNKTVAEIRATTLSAEPRYLAMRERLYDGLRKAGMPEQ